MYWYYSFKSVIFNNEMYQDKLQKGSKAFSGCFKIWKKVYKPRTSSTLSEHLPHFDKGAYHINHIKLYSNIIHQKQSIKTHTWYWGHNLKTKRAWVNYALNKSYNKKTHKTGKKYTTIHNTLCLGNGLPPKSGVE